MPPFDYASLAGPNGTEDNMGGTAQVMYYAPISYFTPSTGIQKRVASPATLAAYAEITTDHTFVTGKGFLKIYVTQDTGKIDDEPKGDRDGRSYLTKAEAFYPGAKSDILGFIRQSKNDRFVVLMKLADGKYRQIGTEDFPAEIIAKWQSGTNSGSKRGAMLTIEGVETGPIVYTGVITEHP